jgi:hypothetical protein
VTTKTLFVVVHEDRHCDVNVYVCADEAWAMKLASRIVGDMARNTEDIDDTLTQPMVDAGWIYHAVYSSEGDYVRVERCPLLDKESSSFEKEH